MFSTSRIGTPLRISEARVRLKSRHADLVRNVAENRQLDSRAIPEFAAFLRFNISDPSVN